MYGALVSVGAPLPPSGDQVGYAFGGDDSQPAALPDQPAVIIGAEILITLALMFAIILAMVENQK